MIELATVGFFVLTCLIAARNAAWALALVFVMYSLEQALQSSSGVFLRIPPLANVCVALSVGACIVGRLPQLERPLRGYATAQLGAVATIFIWSALSLLWTPARESGLELTRSGLPYVVLMVAAAPLLVDELGSLRRFLFAFLLLGTLTTALIVANPAFTVKLGRLGIDIGGGFRTNPLAIGELGGMMLIVGVLSMRIASSATLSAMLRVAACLLGGYLALQSGSRGQLVFALAVSICFTPMARKITNISRFLGVAAGAAILVPLAIWAAQYFLGSQELRRWDLNVLAEGATVRNQNILDLFRAFSTAPMAWFMGLGFNAFTSVTPTIEPYSHIFFVDVLTELGIPMFILLLWWLKKLLDDARWLFQRFGEDADERASITCLCAMFVFQLLIVNKQGYLWSATLFFLPGIMITRLRVREESLDADVVDADTDNGGDEEEYRFDRPRQDASH